MYDRVMLQRKKAVTGTSTSSTFSSSTRDFTLPPTTATPQVTTQPALPGHDFSRISIYPLQAKLTVSQPGDLYEQEADQVAEQVMGMDTPANTQEVQTSSSQQEMPDLQTQPEQRHLPGHDFSKISIFPPQIQQSTSQGDEPSRIEAAVEPVVQRKSSSSNQPAQPTQRPLPGHNFSRIPITSQTKLTVSQPDDPYEQEADRMAEQVMRMPAPGSAEQDEQHQSKQSGFTLNPIATAMMAEIRFKQEFDEAEQLRIINSPLPVPLQRQVEEPELEATDELTQPQNNLPLLKEEEEIYTKPDLQRQATDTPIGDQDLGSRLQQSKGGGSPLADEVRAFMEPRFGADFSQVRVHTGSDAIQMNQNLNAQAFTHKQDVYFGVGKAPARDALTAHELTHVVQQIGVEKATISGLGHSISLVGSVQRFGSHEHKDIGDTASGGAEIDLDNGVKLTYGDMVALAGDYFETINEVQTLAKSDFGREQLRYAKFKALGGTDPHASDGAIKAVKDRYVKLVTKNLSHFSAGGTTKDEYEKVHKQALHVAFLAGATDDASKWPEALATEAFSNHYLTDMFSAGHVRTPRQEIKEWYEQKYPNHLDTKRFVEYMSKWMTEYLNQIGDIPLLIPNSMVEDGIKEQIQAMGGAALEGASIGDIIGGTLHDLDNEGLSVVSDVDPQGKEIPSGYKWQAMGDDFLAYSQETFNMTTAAVRASLADLATAKDAGQGASRGQSVPPDQLEQPAQQTLKMLEPFAAKRFIPREDTSRSSPIPEWKWESLDPFLAERISVWLKKNIVQTLRDMAAGLYPPDGIKRVEMGRDIPVGGPGVGYPPPPSGQPANIPYVPPSFRPSLNIPIINIMNLHVRDALQAFSEHVNQHGFNVLKDAINQVSPVVDVAGSSNSGSPGSGGSADAGSPAQH